MKRVVGMCVGFAALAIALVSPSTGIASTWNFAYTGGTQTWTVPPGVTSATFDVYGAAGGDSGGNSAGLGGEGGRAQATITVVPGATIQVVVGGQGTWRDNNVTGGGFNGGGAACSALGGGGGTDIRIGGTSLNHRVLVAGGGGGAYGSAGGNGGGLTGGGAGGTQTGPGVGTFGVWSGTFGHGGPNNNACPNVNAGGGGGWYGGAGGSGQQTGGGGGSGYGPAGTYFETGVRTGSGFASITVPDVILTVTHSTRQPGPQTGGIGHVTGSGINCGWTANSCWTEVPKGTPVTLTATPVAGEAFSSWGGACAGVVGPVCTVSMDTAKTVHATFELTRLPLTVTKPGNGSGTVASTPVQYFTTIDCGAVCSSGYINNTSVTLTATAATGSDFTGWSGVCAGAGSTCTLGMTAARSVQAIFTLQKRALSVARTGSGVGNIRSTPTGINCGATCSADVDYGQPVTLTATPVTGSSFVRWGAGPCAASGTSPACVVSITQAETVIAQFSVPQQPLTLTRSGAGTGSITSMPSGVTCSTASCTTNHEFGATVTLSANAGTNSTFSGWTGACAGSSFTCTVSMFEAKTVNAVFPLAQRALTILPQGDTPGVVTTAPAGSSFTHGTSVTITAASSASSDVQSWSAPCVGSTNSCTVTMDQARTISITYSRRTYPVSMLTSGTGSGTLFSNLQAFTCPPLCGLVMAHGSPISLTPMADPSSEFTGWTGACSGTGACNLTINQATTIGATFTLKRYTLSTGTSGTGTGTVSSNRVGDTFDHGAQVTLTAAPSATSDFAGWTGPCSGANATCVVTMDQARSATATFTLKSHALATATNGTGGGTVMSAPAGSVFDHDTSVTLTAAPNANSDFTGWSGACTGTDPECTVTMDQARSATATFTLKSHAFDVTTIGTGTGTVESDPAGSAFDHGTSVKLTAKPSASSTFTGWSGACTGTDPECTVAADQSRTVTAEFTLRKHQLSVTTTGTGSGSVSAAPSDSTLDHGTGVTLTAVSASGSTFTGWSGACSGSSTTCELTIVGATDAAATFTLVPSAADVQPTQPAAPAAPVAPGGGDAINPFAPFRFVGTVKNERVTGRAGNDVLDMRGGNDTASGKAGNDKLYGGPGNDKLDGGAGNDTIVGGTGADRLAGGPGNDTINARDGKAGDIVTCGAGTDKVTADPKDRVAKDCERITRR